MRSPRQAHFSSPICPSRPDAPAACLRKGHANVSPGLSLLAPSRREEICLCWTQCANSLGLHWRSCVEFLWPSLKREIQAYVALLPDFSGNWNRLWCPKFIDPTPPRKDGRLQAARRRCLSSRVAVVFWSDCVFVVRLAASCAQEHALQQLIYEQVPDLPEFGAELPSGVNRNLVDYGGFLREDILLLEARSAIRAVQSACQMHQNVRKLFWSTVWHWF